MTRKFLLALCAGLFLSGLSVPPAPVMAGDQPFVGEIAWVPFNFAPKGWALCDGQLMPISLNTALFSLLGAQYGGDGKSTFALPNLQGRVLISAGQSTTGSIYYNGDSGGDETNTLLTSEIPVHTHTVNATAVAGSATSPAGAYLGAATSGTQYGNSPTGSMAPQTLSIAGSSMPHNNMMPYTTLNCIIALQGVFPPRP